MAGVRGIEVLDSIMKVGLYFLSTSQCGDGVHRSFSREDREAAADCIWENRDNMRFVLQSEVHVDLMNYALFNVSQHTYL